MKYCSALVLALFGLSAHAAVVTWDADPATPGAQDGAGTWDAANTNWWDGAANTNWADAAPDAARIGATSGAAGVISLSGTRTAAGLRFIPAGSGSYALTNGALNLGAGGLVTAPFADPGLPLDNVSTDALAQVISACSLRRVFSAYAGPAISVRRTSDNTTQDIAFTTSGDLDTAALLTFVGASDGVVERLYPQVGTVAVVRIRGSPRIVIGGALQTWPHGQPRIVQVGAADGLRTSGLTNLFAGGGGTVFYVVSKDSTAGGRTVTGTNGNWLVFHWSQGEGDLHFNATPSSLPNGNLTLERKAWSFAADAASVQIYRNGLQFGTFNTPSLTSPGELDLNGVGAYSEPSSSSFGELLLFGAKLGAADLAAVHRSQGYRYTTDFSGPPQGIALHTPVTLAAAQEWMTTTGAALSVSAAIDNGGNLLTINNAGGMMLSGALSGTGGLQKIGAGELVLTGAVGNAHAGGTTLVAGRLGLAKTGGAVAVPGDFIGDNFTSPDVYATVPNQFAPGSVMRFVGTAGDHLRFELLGTTQTLAGIDNAASPGRGVIQQREQVAPASVGSVSRLVLDGFGQYSFDAYLRDSGGQMAVTKTGSGTQTLANTVIDYTGVTLVSGGLLRFLNLDDYWTTQVTINAGATLVNENVSRAFAGKGRTTYRGGGTWRKTGTQVMDFSFDVGCTVAFDPGALMEIQQGVVRLGYGNLANFASNRASLHLAAGSVFDLWDNELNFGGVFVDALTGSGSVRKTTYGTAGRLNAGVNGGSGTYYGMITNESGRHLELVKLGAGTLTLAGTNRHTGATTVNAGTLALAASGSISNSATISVSPGALLDLTAGPGYAIRAGQVLAGGGLVTGALLLADGAILAPGSLGAAGTLTFGNDLTLSAGSTNAVELINPAVTGGVNDLTVVAGELVPNGAKILLNAALSNGTYTVMTYGTKTGSFDPTAASATRGSATVDETTPGEIRLDLIAGSASLVWNSIAGTNWDTGVSLNWLNDTTNDVFLSGDAVLFNDLSGVVTSIGIAAVVLPASVTVDTSTNAFTIAGTGGIGGLGALTKSGSSQFTVGTANSYAGGTLVAGGSVKIRHSAALGGGAVSVAAGASLQLGPGGLVVTNALTLNGVTPGGALIGGVDSGTLFNRWTGPITLAGGTNNVTTWWSDKTLDLAGLVTGPGALLVERVGTNNASVVMLSGTANDYAGGTIVSNATLILNNAGGNAIGSGGLQIMPAGTLQLGNNTAGGSLLMATITNSGLLAINRSDAYLFTNNVTGTGGMSVFNNNSVGGGSTVALGGGLRAYGAVFTNTTASFVGFSYIHNAAGLTIREGANVTLGHLQEYDAGNLFIGGGTVTVTGNTYWGRDSGCTITQTGGVFVLRGLNSRQGPDSGNGGGGYSASYGGSGHYTFNLNGGTFVSTVGWLDEGSGAFGAWWSDQLNWGGGTLEAAANCSVAGRLLFTGTGGSFTVDTAGRTVAINLPSYYPGHTAIGGAGGLNVRGGGTVELNYPGAYSGPTLVSGATLRVRSVITTSAVSVAVGGTLAGTGAVLNAVSNAGTVAPGTVGTAGLLTVGAYLPAGGGILGIDLGGTTQGSQYDCLVASNGATLAGILNVSLIGAYIPTHGDTFTILRGGPVFGTFAVTNLVLPLGFGGEVQYTPTSVVVGVTGSLSVLSWRPTEQAEWDLTRTNWLDNNTNVSVFSQSATVRFDDLGAYSNVVTLTTNLQPNRVVVDSTSNYWFQGTGYLSGGMELVKTGAATLVVTTTNNFSGRTTIHEGTLQLGDGGICGTLGSSVISNRGTLAFNHGDTTAVGAVISGTGALVKQGPGALTLLADNLYTGSTTVAGGRLVLNTPNFNTYRGGTIAINNGAQLWVTQSGGATRYDFPGKTFAFDSSGGGAVVLGTNLNFTFVGGGCTFTTDGGAQNAILGASGINMAGNAITFAVARGTDTVDLAVAVAMGNSGAGLIKNGAGILLLATNNSFTGGVMLNAGVLAVGHDGSMGTGTLTMGGGTLAAAGGARMLPNLVSVTAGGVVDTTGGDVTLAGVVSGAGGLVKSGVGSLTLPAANTHNGTITVSNGLLLVQGSILSAVTVETNATLGGTGVVRGAVTQYGTLDPGASIGTLTISNQVNCSGTAVTRFELGGTNAPTDYDQLIVGDLHTLAGTLVVVTTNGYVPASGDAFLIISNSALGGALFGTFTTESLPALASGLGWVVQYNGTESVGLLVTGTVASATAYELWAQSITNPALRGEQEDPDGDGYANLFEYSQGSDATNAADNAKLHLARTNGQFLAAFNRVNTATDIVYEVEGAYAPTNGATWLGVATNAIGSWGSSTNVNDNNTATIHRVWVTDLELGTNRTLRLKITRP